MERRVRLETGVRGLLRHVCLLLLLGSLLSACGSANPYQGLGADQIFELAMQRFQEEEWDEAIEAFERVVFSFPGYQQVAQARFHLAEAYFEKEEYITAVSEFTRFMDRFPTHTLAAEASLGICRSYEELSPIVQRDQDYTRQAYQACGNTARDFPGTEEARQAAQVRDRMWSKMAEKTYVSGEFYFDRELWDSALIYFEDVVDNYPDTPSAPRALRRMIETYEEIGYEEEAGQARERLLEEYPDSDAAQEIRQRTGNGL